MMAGMSCWCASPWHATHLLVVRTGTQTESAVRCKSHAAFGAGKGGDALPIATKSAICFSRDGEAVFSVLRPIFLR